MKFIVICIFVSIYSLISNAIIKIAVIDTGVRSDLKHKFNICGEFDYTGFGMEDNIGHGTAVIQFITKDLNKLDYCLVLYKFTDLNYKGDTLANFRNILFDIHIDNSIEFINISAGGWTYDRLEHKLILQLLDTNKTIITAAGNENTNLDENCNFYPACYDKRVIVVGNKQNENNSRQKSSNYGNIIDVWYAGMLDVVPFLPNAKGTSQATAMATNIIVKGKLYELKREVQKTGIRCEARRK